MHLPCSRLLLRLLRVGNNRLVLASFYGWITEIKPRYKRVRELCLFDLFSSERQSDALISSVMAS